MRPRAGTPSRPIARWLLPVTASLVLAGACSSSDSDTATPAADDSPPTSETVETASGPDESAESAASPEGGGEVEIVSPTEAAASGACSTPAADPSAASEAEDLEESEEGDEGATTTGSALTAAEIVDLVEPGVVVITAIGPPAEDTASSEAEDAAPPEPAIETGSGVVVNDAGLIVTNRHVVEGAEVVVAQGVDNRIRDANVVGVVSGDGDLALIEVTDADGLDPVELGSSDAVEIGDPVLAMGSPVDVGLSVSAGILSGRGRNIKVEDAALFDLLQTDAAINPGNSGGPLVDQAGRLIGINTAVAEAEGVGFAVPVEQVRQFIENATTGVPTPTLGTQFVTMTAERIVEVGAPVLAGSLAVVVADDGPAGEADLLVGDIVTAANGRPVYTVTELNEAVMDAGVEETLELLVCRQTGDDAWSEVEVNVIVGGRDVEDG